MTHIRHLVAIHLSLSVLFNFFLIYILGESHSVNLFRVVSLSIGSIKVWLVFVFGL